jgi:hypothetical protein
MLVVPNEYFCPLDSTGRRTDMNERPELSRGCVEFIAPSEYMVRPPQPPSYFFVIGKTEIRILTFLRSLRCELLFDNIWNVSYGDPQYQISLKVIPWTSSNSYWISHF